MTNGQFLMTNEEAIIASAVIGHWSLAIQSYIGDRRTGETDDIGRLDLDQELRPAAAGVSPLWI
jgi:hypothetical protein